MGILSNSPMTPVWKQSINLKKREEGTSQSVKMYCFFLKKKKKYYSATNTIKNVQSVYTRALRNSWRLSSLPDVLRSFWECHVMLKRVKWNSLWVTSGLGGMHVDTQRLPAWSDSQGIYRLYVFYSIEQYIFTLWEVPSSLFYKLIDCFDTGIIGLSIQIPMRRGHQIIAGRHYLVPGWPKNKADIFCYTTIMVNAIQWVRTFTRARGDISAPEGTIYTVMRIDLHYGFGNY